MQLDAIGWISQCQGQETNDYWQVMNDNKCIAACSFFTLGKIGMSYNSFTCQPSPLPCWRQSRVTARQTEAEKIEVLICRSSMDPLTTKKDKHQLSIRSYPHQRLSFFLESCNVQKREVICWLHRISQQSRITDCFHRPLSRSTHGSWGSLHHRDIHPSASPGPHIQTFHCHCHERAKHGEMD